MFSCLSLSGCGFFPPVFESQAAQHKTTPAQEKQEMKLKWTYFIDGSGGDEDGVGGDDGGSSDDGSGIDGMARTKKKRETIVLETEANKTDFCQRYANLVNDKTLTAIISTFQPVQCDVACVRCLPELFLVLCVAFFFMFVLVYTIRVYIHFLCGIY